MTFVFDELHPLGEATPRFTEEKLAEAIQWFDQTAKPLLLIPELENAHVVTIEEFVRFLDLKIFHKRNFKYPSYREIMAEVEKIHADYLKVLTKEQFIYILDTRVLEPQIKHELLLALKLFDTENRNYLEADEIAGILTSFDNPFNEDELREILRDADVHGDGRIFYEDFIESLFSTKPELYKLKAEYLYENPEEDPSVEPDEEILPAPKKSRRKSLAASKSKSVAAEDVPPA